ncbi:unnamed protein product [Nezara viridula]|uniref:Uncharacterized protein n=1 Tax=Nezara viridula TaxID=85310 RepID=A0A9P0E6R2_NEZVI|nr:unnamed protein product [Nezara viridula]
MIEVFIDNKHRPYIFSKLGREKYFLNFRYFKTFKHGNLTETSKDL